MIAAFAVRLIGQELTEPLVGQLLTFVIGLIMLTIIFYIAGRLVVGKKRALFSDAFVISLLGTIVANIVFLFVEPLLIGLILSLVIWLLLVKHYYETGWLGALAVAVWAVIIYVAIVFILSLLVEIPPLLFEGLASLLIC